MFTLEKRGLRGDLITTFQPLNRTTKKRRSPFYMEKVRGDGNMLLLEILIGDKRKTFYKENTEPLE